MSDSLTYLIQARPEALSHYFAFLKDAGKYLDPKTRNLISVITKVHAQTDRGFRQYLRRALREGCTAKEILDALLMAFPALGLARIVWATDIILDMKIPEFQIEALKGEPRWHDVMASSEVRDAEVTRTECDGRGLFVYRNKRNYKVYDSRCPHQSSDIPLSAHHANGTLTCPKHGWSFDIQSGDCIKKGKTPLTRLTSKVLNGRLLVHW